MIQRVLVHYSMPELTCVGLILFMVVFSGALAWVFRRGSGQVYQDLQNLPFEKEN